MVIPGRVRSTRTRNPETMYGVCVWIPGLPAVRASRNDGERRMALTAHNLEPPVDGRQSETALAVARGTARLLHAHGFSVVSELPLPSGRRADLVALDTNG